VIGEPRVVPVAGAWVDGTTAIFRVSDPGHRLAGVRLSQDVRIPRFDAHERRFPYYQRVVRFVAGVDGGAQPGTLPARRVPVVLTCGAIEENVENNRLMEHALRARGYPAELTEVPDMHNFTAWRDAFHPHLTRLVRQVSG
jgi:hypothetical protein